ncbi:hypothetical protein F4803DRAFT_441208 [Xylaria telfairii]|nr:hypothetical protein F4803DRAFT_441208 [Xylaria telfairii]
MMETHGSTSTSSVSNDPLELFDFVKYNGAQYQSPSLSPTSAGKAQFTPPTTAMTTTPATLPTSQVLSGPSHQYDAYKQQTPLVPGALANTLAINEASLQMGNFALDFINPGEELYDFNTTTSSQNTMASPDMDIDFDSPAEPTFFFPPTPAVNPHQNNAASTSVATQPGAVGRMYPGVHAQRAAMAKAQAQAKGQVDARADQKLKHQIEMMRRQEQQLHHQQLHRPQQAKQSRPKASQPPDPIVEQKITQLLNSMRSNPTPSETDDADSPLVQVPRLKKEQDDMDEDERLLASEEGKKLSSKERRQLRNKVSARAFRSRRKEYIGQLEHEVAGKVTEANELRAENRALREENMRLSNLTRILLESPSFTSFLDALSQNPATILAQVQPQVEQRQPEPPKDANPYNTTSFGQQQQIGMAMIPEQSMDYSMLHNAGVSQYYQPHVYAVLETPELPEIDTDALMGKSSNFIEEAPTSDNDKADAPFLEPPVPSTIQKLQVPEVNPDPTPVQKKASNLDGDIFDDDADDDSAPPSCPLELDTGGFSAVDIFGGIESEKAFARYELVDSSEEEKQASIALKRVERLAASLAATISGLERLDMDV